MRKYCKVDRERGVKVCPECDVEKPVEDFPHRKDGSIYAYCRPCSTARAVKWSVNNRERKSAGERARRARNPEKTLSQFRKRHYPKRYGISHDQVLVLLETQSSRCEICSKEICENTLYVDHCHSTESVRGILCNRCNIGLASIEREGFLDAALSYLERHRSKS